MNVRKSTVSTKVSIHFWKQALLTMSVLLNIVLFTKLVWGSHSFSVYRALVVQCQEIMEEIKRNDVVIADLSHEIQLLQSSPSYIEKMVRQRLNFVKDNEILYLFTQKDK